MSAHVGIPQTAHVGGGSLSVRTRINQIHDSAIPNDWSLRTLGEIGQCLIGLTYDPKNISANGVLVLRSSNIDNNTLQFGDDIYVEMDIPERINVREGDLLICVRNGSRPLIGKCALVEPQAAGMTFGAFMSVFRSNDSRFVSYCFQSDIVKRQIHKHLGATINQITNKSLNSFKIPYPGSRERTAIAEALSDVDGLLAALERLIDKKRAIKRAAMQQLLTGKTRLPGFSGEWETKRVADFGRIVTGATPRTEIKAFWDGRYPWITPSDISSHRDMATSERMISEVGLNSIRRLPKDTVLVTCIASIGKNAILRSEGGCNQQINAVIPTNAHSAEFLYYLFEFNKQYLLAKAGTTATSIVSKAAFGNLRFKVPLLKEQAAIADSLSDMDSAIAALERRRDKTRAIKQGMMQALLTGRVRLVEPETVSEQEARTVASYREGAEA